MIDVILQKLEKVSPKGKDSYMARCPAHDDKSPSLSLAELPDGRILIKCFAGCPTNEVLSAVGLRMTDLFPDGGLGDFKGWQQLQNQRKPDNSLDKTILAISDSDRKAGKRLTRKELEREQQAYLRTRA